MKTDEDLTKALKAVRYQLKISFFVFFIEQFVTITIKTTQY